MDRKIHLIHLIDHWTHFRKSDVPGDPTLATAEKGKVIFEVVEACLIHEFKDRPRGERTNYHRQLWLC